jgi:hypothetical protein
MGDVRAAMKAAADHMKDVISRRDSPDSRRVL